MDEKTAAALKYLRLPGLLANWDQILSLAAKGRYSHGRLLQEAVAREEILKREHARISRLKHAGYPEHLVLETYPFGLQPKLDRQRIISLYEAFEYLPKRQNIVFCGPTGAGKTGLATAFLIQAIERGYRGRYVLFAELMTELLRSAADHSQPKVLHRYQSYDCLLIDEVGYGESDAVAVGIFFTLLSKRHKQKTTLITSNLGFADWHTFLKNEHLAAALIDRLTESSHIINMRNCRSLRPRMEAKP